MDPAGVVRTSSISELSDFIIKPEEKNLLRDIIDDLERKLNIK
jgi:hypothetical protein